MITNCVRAVADELKIQLFAAHERSDSAIAESIALALRWSNEVPTNVDAEVKDGFVTLKGTCEWEYERSAATRAVQNIRGVVGVLNLVVNQNTHPTPADLEHRIRLAFDRNARLDARQVGVSITNGTAHLHGHVHSIHEKHVAQDAAAAAPGVTHVDDQLLVLP